MDKEQQVLGACLLSKKALLDAVEVLRPEDFNSDVNQQLFKDMMNLVDKGEEEIDIPTLCEYSKVDNGYIVSLPDGVFSINKTRKHAELVKKDANKRRVFNKLSEIYMKANNMTLEELAYKIDAELLPLTKDNSHETLTMKELMHKIFENLEEMAEGKNQFIKTGFRSLDRVILGYEPGEIYIMAGRPSMGKTSFALNSALSIDRRYKVLMFSLEMDAMILGKRLVSIKGHIDFEGLRTGQLSPEEWKKVLVASEYVSEKDIDIRDSISDIVGIVNTIRKVKPDIVFVDYLQLVQGGNFSSKNLEVSYVSRKLKLLAMEMKIPIVVVSQLSRATETRNNKRPQMSDLRDSGSIEQDASTIIMLYRDWKYDPNTDKAYYNSKTGDLDYDVAEINVVKQRNGATKNIEMVYIGKYMTFVEKEGE